MFFFKKRRVKKYYLVNGQTMDIPNELTKSQMNLMKKISSENFFRKKGYEYSVIPKNLNSMIDDKLIEIRDDGLWLSPKGLKTHALFDSKFFKNGKM